MIRKLYRGLAKILFWCASSFLVASFFTLALGCFLLTWPFVHGNSANRRSQSAIGLAAAFMTFLSTLPNPTTVLNEAMHAAQEAAMVATEDPNSFMDDPELDEE